MFQSIIAIGEFPDIAVEVEGSELAEA